MIDCKADIHNLYVKANFEGMTYDLIKELLAINVAVCSGFELTEKGGKTCTLAEKVMFIAKELSDHALKMEE